MPTVVTDSSSPRKNLARLRRMRSIKVERWDERGSLLVVVCSDACVEPFAMMIKAKDTLVT